MPRVANHTARLLQVTTMDGIGTPPLSLSASFGARVPAYFAWRFI
jgi:hypothetical protein